MMDLRREGVTEVVKHNGHERLQKFAGSTWAINGYPNGFDGKMNWFKPKMKKFAIFFKVSPSET
jgi:hypothetical protein